MRGPEQVDTARQFNKARLLGDKGLEAVQSSR